LRIMFPSFKTLSAKPTNLTFHCKAVGHSV